MGSIESDRLFLLLATILLMVQYCGLTAARVVSVSHSCMGGNYSTITDKTYQTNLDILLYSLSTFQIRLGIGKGYYYNYTVGQNPDTVYGSVQCRGDLVSETCRRCVETAAQDISRSDRCLNSKEAIIWYDECMLRYSNKLFFSIMKERPSFYLWSEDISYNEITNLEQFNLKVAELMDVLVSEAVSYNTSLFAIGETSFQESTKMYGLVQCTFDLSSSSCSRCFKGEISKLPRCCYGNSGGRDIGPSCLLKYVYFFYEPRETAPPPSTPLLNAAKKKTKGKNSSKIVIVTIVPTVITVLSTISICYICLQRRKATKETNDVEEIQSAESLQFKFNTIKAATDNFSDANKLGRGGFGSVYKGTLSDGQEIAVKRLSINSGQGEEEFKNEAVLLVKLQHKHLVRLLGFCLDGEEKLLVYEFMPHASLDQFIFDPFKRIYLYWERRYTIIKGIARGLLYLHEDSQLKIIHRDLKASNVLLGDDLNPKISDFGMARMLIVDQTQARTNKIVGTYGYMAPEYAMHGQFSVRSDVFSFGVLVLEIVSGKRNNSFYGSKEAQDLLSYAWQHWKEGTALELLDPILRDHYSRIEVMRCIHIGLLSVQEDVADRPTMSSIVNKLNNYSVTLNTPMSPPAYFVHTSKEHEKPLRESKMTINQASITELYPR